MGSSLEHIETIEKLCRKVADELGGRGSFRLRVLMQMLLLELEKERARLAREEKPGPSRDP